ncbi:hypothetical protein CMI37_24315 [Candidatus Pacearchaeota archaeon]|jgi:hypothetical protein|nr:hypothetical protein [Candidatus Pacearchaeota archaeon]|tara:strand:- start:4003 stop:4779 length:777 start_codon:yes stop_codon:yes gene_type:complete
MHIVNFDKKYLEWAKLFVESNLLVNPDEKIYLSTVNLTDEDIENLHIISENLIIENEAVDPKDVPVVAERITEHNKTDRYGPLSNRMPEFMASRIPEVFKRAFERFTNENLFVLTGADTFVNKKFPFKDFIESHDAGLLTGNTGSPPSNIATGVVCLKNRQPCKELVDLWVDYSENKQSIRGYLKGYWFWDQVTLNCAAEDMVINNKLTIKELPHMELINANQDKEAYMWSVHKLNKEGRKKVFHSWVEELEKRRKLC